MVGEGRGRRDKDWAWRVVGRGQNGHGQGWSVLNKRERAKHTVDTDRYLEDASRGVE